MKRIIFSLSVLALISCKDVSKEPSQENTQDAKDMAIASETKYASFGEKIDEENVISASEMKAKFDAMSVGDTLDVKFKSTVDKVCKEKGCWMKLKLADSLTSFVKFKDYKFFVPLDAENKETIVEGKAYITETPVEELKHYAQDAGKTEEEIAAITEPKKEYAFMATGVLMEKPTKQ
ncbi:protein of unknown function [Mesonia phycicola]|uniref:DUF4920 domain-containing protein n=1 Tax=Mesonia phycicola TaxID=579105 RepID=A0A1M6AR81_9FLAO|nr:DUF4920 domain-containing protein [Mesonia phycicola]SHI38917.1 protein of unknown function [Mesonia phycicola]